MKLSTWAQTLNTFSHLTPGLAERAIERLGEAMDVALAKRGLQ